MSVRFGGFAEPEGESPECRGEVSPEAIGMYAADYARLPSMAPANSATNPNTPEIDATIR